MEDTLLFRELTKVVQTQCAMCKTPIDKDEHLCPECWKKEKMDQERETYIDLLGGRK